MKTTCKRRFVYVAYILFWTLIAVGIVEVIGRKRLHDTQLVPGTEILKVQSLLKLHEKIGYLWKENLAWEDNILLPWKDQKPLLPLSTDAFGFRNAPSAISLRSQGKQINIVGLGDSFIHDAAYILHDFFSSQGIFYYNFAMHRHCPPQYNLILRQYALPTKPALILYGIFENDFYETIDFYNWTKSGLTWYKH